MGSSSFRTAALVATLFLLCSTALHAESAADAGGSAQSLLARLGSPARDSVVRESIATLEPADTDGAVRLAHALGHAGGCAAVEGIRALLDHADEEVRLAATEAAGRLQLRAETLAAQLRRTVTEGRGREQIAAAEALGHVGDGRDAAALLELALEEDPRLQAAAFRSLAQLTGAQVPFVHARWTYYWKSYERRSALLLPQAQLALADAPDAPDTEALVDLVLRYGWVELPAIRDTLQDWMVSPDHGLRAIACRLAAGLRLADLAPEVEMTLRFAGRQEDAQVAKDALAALGFRVSDAEEPKVDEERGIDAAERR